MNSSHQSCQLSNRLSTIGQNTTMKILPGPRLFKFLYISLQKIFFLEMNSLYHFNLPTRTLVFRKRQGVRYLKGFGDFLRISSRILSQRILRRTPILKFPSYRLLARRMQLMAVSFRLFNRYIGQRRTMLLGTSNYI